MGSTSHPIRTSTSRLRGIRRHGSQVHDPSSKAAITNLENISCEYMSVTAACLAYNLANFLRRLALPRDVKHWTLTTLREKLIKIGAKVTWHARYITFQLVEVAVPRRLFAAILDRISRLAIPPPGVERHPG